MSVWPSLSKQPTTTTTTRLQLINRPLRFACQMNNAPTRGADKLTAVANIHKSGPPSLWFSRPTGPIMMIIPSISLSPPPCANKQEITYLFLWATALFLFTLNYRCTSCNGSLAPIYHLNALPFFHNKKHFRPLYRCFACKTGPTDLLDQKSGSPHFSNYVVQ